MEKSNVEIMRTATELEVMRRRLGVAPAAAEAVRVQGRAQFYDAFWGRYGLPGNTMSQRDFGAVNPDEQFDLTDMPVADVIALAQDMVKANKIGSLEGSLLGFEFDRLPYAQDKAFLSSPLAILRGGLDRPSAMGRTYNWLGEYQNQLRHLENNRASASAIKGTRNVLQELSRLQTEQNLYWAMGFYQDGSDREGGNLFTGGLVSPSNLIALLNAEA